jgi:hypothetical protein
MVLGDCHGLDVRTALSQPGGRIRDELLHGMGPLDATSAGIVDQRFTGEHGRDRWGVPVQEQPEVSVI